MARSAMALRLSGQSYEVTGNGVINLMMIMDVLFTDDDDPGNPFAQQVDVNVVVPSSATPNEIKTAMTDTVIDYGVNGGYMQRPVAVTANQVILPDLSRG